MTEPQPLNPAQGSDARGNPEAIWRLVMAMKLNGLPREALKDGFMADFEISQFNELWALPYAQLCLWGTRHD